MPNVMCKHVVKGVGCGIYSERPRSCQSFSCMWVLRDDTLPDSLKPNKCHAVLAMYEGKDKDITVYVDPAYSLAHREGDLALLLERLVDKGYLILVAVGSKVYHRLGRQWVQGKVVRDPEDPFSGKIEVFNVGGKV